MPPWLAAGMIVASVAVVCALYSLWNTPPPNSHGPGGHCNIPGCRFHNHQSGPSNQNNDWYNNNSGSSRQNCDWQERYDTPPDFRHRHTTDEECPICLEHLFNSPQTTLKCHHRLHSECFRKLRLQSQSCPICRRPL